MKISSIPNQNYYSSQPAFKAQFGNIVNDIVSKAYFSSYGTKNPKIIEKTARRTAALKNMHPNYTLTTFLDGNNHGQDFYNFILTPQGLNKSCGKTIAKIPNKTPALVMLAKLEQAFKKFKP